MMEGDEGTAAGDTIFKDRRGRRPKKSMLARSRNCNQLSGKEAERNAWLFVCSLGDVVHGVGSERLTVGRGTSIGLDGPGRRVLGSTSSLPGIKRDNGYVEERVIRFSFPLPLHPATEE